MPGELAEQQPAEMRISREALATAALQIPQRSSLDLQEARGLMAARDRVEPMPGKPEVQGLLTPALGEAQAEHLPPSPLPLPVARVGFSRNC